MKYLPYQLIQDFFHQQYLCCIADRLCCHSKLTETASPETKPTNRPIGLIDNGRLVSSLLTSCNMLKISLNAWISMTHDSYYPQLWGRKFHHSLNSQSSWRTHQSWSCQYPRGRRYCPQGWHHKKGKGTDEPPPKPWHQKTNDLLPDVASGYCFRNPLDKRHCKYMHHVCINISFKIYVYVLTSMHIICAKCTRKSQHMWVCQNQINMSFKKQVEVFRAFRTPPSEYPAPLLHLGQDTAPSVEVVLFRPNG